MSYEDKYIMSEGFADLVIDVPMGWKYGFPRPYTWKPSRPGLSKAKQDQEFEAWIRACGYPQKLIDEGNLKHCRFWRLHR